MINPRWAVALIGCAVVATAARAADPAQALKAKGWAVGAEGADVTQLIAPRDPKSAATADDVAALAQFPKLKVLRLYGAGVADDSLAVLDKLLELRELVLECPNVTDATAKRLRSQTGLTELSLDGSGFTAAGYEQLPVFEKLTKLHLDGRITGPAVAQLPVKFPNAEQLFFNHPRGFNDAEFAPLAQLKKAEWIVLSGSPTLTDAAADTLAKMPSLRKIEVGHVGHFTDKGLEKLKGLPNLEMLQLGSSGVTDAGMAHLAEIPTLRELVLGDPSPITAKGIESLAELPNLRKLALQTPSLTDDVMPHVARMKALEELDLVSSGFTDAALPPLLELPHLKRLRIGEFYRQPKLTDAGLKTLAGLKGVDEIIISPLCKGVTDSGVAALKAALPKVKIYR